MHSLEGLLQVEVKRKKERHLRQMEQHEHSDENKKHMINLKKLVSVEHDESLSFIL